MNEHCLYPIFLSISGKPCLIVGGGSVAERKARDLIEAGADITVVAEKPSREFLELSAQDLITLKTRRFEPADCECAFLVFAATDDEAVNIEINEASKLNRSLVNVIDTPELCDFFSGAVVKRGPLRIAISTCGLSPGIASQIRRELEELYPDSFADFIETVGEMRRKILSQKDISEDKKNAALLLLSQKETRTIFFTSGKDKVWEELKKLTSI